MMVPATAPRTPACQDPSLLSMWPWSSLGAGASPKYRTSPSLSGASQSRVFSARLPSARRRMSLTTVVVTPWITLVRLVTTTRSRYLSPSSVPRYRDTVPGRRGKYGFCCGLLNWPGFAVTSFALGAGPRADADTAQTPPTVRTAAARTESLLTLMAFSLHGVDTRVRAPH